MTIRPAAFADCAAIAEIYDEGIASGLATFATGPHNAAERAKWLAARVDRAPVFVAVADEVVRGWSALAPFSHRPWYNGVGEYTAYVANSARGQGLGRLLVDHLVGVASEYGYWKLVGMILPENAAGLALARAAGFRLVGTHSGHAELGGCWQDVSVVERHVASPQH